MFFVVFYDVWCSTAPKSWINKKLQTVRWPPKNENPTTAAIKELTPKKNWKTIKYSRLLGPYQTFDIARAVEIAAVDISTSDEAAMSKLKDGDQLTQKRTRKTPVRYRKESSSETGSSDNEDKGVDGDNETSPKDLFNYDATNNGNDNNDIETQELDYGDFSNDPPSTVTSEPATKNITVENIEVPNLIISYAPKLPTKKVLPKILSIEQNIQTLPDVNGNNIGKETSVDNSNNAEQSSLALDIGDEINDTNLNSVKSKTSSKQLTTSVSFPQVSKQNVDAGNRNLECSQNCCGKYEA